jgi:hypothetical protein
MPFVFEHNRSYRENDKKYNYKEHIIDGEKGTEFSLLKKEGEKFYKIKVKETSKDSFSVTEKIGEKETSKEMDIKELNKMLKSNKDLDFAKKFFDTERGKYKGIEDALLSEELAGGKKKTTKKASKKVSKKKASKKKVSKKKPSRKKVSKKY